MQQQSRSSWVNIFGEEVNNLPYKEDKASWCAAFLENWMIGEGKKPKSKELREELKAISDCSKKLSDLLIKFNHFHHIDCAKDEFTNYKKEEVINMLNDIQERAENSRALAFSKGGPKTASPISRGEVREDTMPSKLMCALMVLVFWNAVYGEFPKDAKGKEITQIASSNLWEISGGQPIGREGSKDFGSWDVWLNKAAPDKQKIWPENWSMWTREFQSRFSSRFPK